MRAASERRRALVPLKAGVVGVALAGLALAVGAPPAPPAGACTIKLRNPPNTPQEKLAAAKAKIAGAAAVIDGEVVTPYKDARHPAVVRAWHVFKGPRKAEYQIGDSGPCGWTLDRAGVRARFFLVGGPVVYTASMNIGDPEFEDRVLGSDRSKDWPFRSP